MATVLYSAMLPEVSPHVSGAPETLVVNAIRNACIAFCEQSWCWQYDIDPFALAAGVQDYPIDSTVVPSGSAVAAILYGWWNGLPVDPITKDEAMEKYPNWRNTQGSTPKRFMAGDAMTKVSIIPVPSGNSPTGAAQTIVPNGMTFTLALKPTRASTGFPDFLNERYLEDIAHGAIARVTAIPHKSYSNVNVSQAHNIKFIDACANARQDSSKAFTRANLRNRQTGVARW